MEPQTPAMDRPDVVSSDATSGSLLNELGLQRRMLFGMELTLLAGVIFLATSSPAIPIALGLIGLVVTLAAL